MLQFLAKVLPLLYRRCIVLNDRGIFLVEDTVIVEYQHQQGFGLDRVEPVEQPPIIATNSGGSMSLTPVLPQYSQSPFSFESCSIWLARKASPMQLPQHFFICSRSEEVLDQLDMMLHGELLRVTEAGIVLPIVQGHILLHGL